MDRKAKPGDLSLGLSLPFARSEIKTFSASATAALLPPGVLETATKHHRSRSTGRPAPHVDNSREITKLLAPIVSSIAIKLLGALANRRSPDAPDTAALELATAAAAVTTTYTAPGSPPHLESDGSLPPKLSSVINSVKGPVGGSRASSRAPPPAVLRDSHSASPPRALFRKRDMPAELKSRNLSLERGGMRSPVAETGTETSSSYQILCAVRDETLAAVAAATARGIVAARDAAAASLPDDEGGPIRTGQRRPLRNSPGIISTSPANNQTRAAAAAAVSTKSKEPAVLMSRRQGTQSSTYAAPVETGAASGGASVVGSPVRSNGFDSPREITAAKPLVSSGSRRNIDRRPQWQIAVNGSSSRVTAVPPFASPLAAAGLHDADAAATAAAAVGDVNSARASRSPHSTLPLMQPLALPVAGSRSLFARAATSATDTSTAVTPAAASTAIGGDHQEGHLTQQQQRLMSPSQQQQQQSISHLLPVVQSEKRWVTESGTTLTSVGIPALMQTLTSVGIPARMQQPIFKPAAAAAPPPFPGDNAHIYSGAHSTSTSPRPLSVAPDADAVDGRRAQQRDTDRSGVNEDASQRSSARNTGSAGSAAESTSPSPRHVRSPNAAVSAAKSPTAASAATTAASGAAAASSASGAVSPRRRWDTSPLRRSLSDRELHARDPDPFKYGAVMPFSHTAAAAATVVPAPPPTSTSPRSPPAAQLTSTSARRVVQPVSNGSARGAAAGDVFDSPAAAATAAGPVATTAAAAASPRTQEQRELVEPSVRPLAERPLSVAPSAARAVEAEGGSSGPIDVDLEGLASSAWKVGALEEEEEITDASAPFALFNGSVSYIAARQQGDGAPSSSTQRAAVESPRPLENPSSSPTRTEVQPSTVRGRKLLEAGVSSPVSSRPLSGLKALLAHATVLAAAAATTGSPSPPVSSSSSVLAVAGQLGPSSSSSVFAAAAHSGSTSPTSLPAAAAAAPYSPRVSSDAAASAAPTTAAIVTDLPLASGRLPHSALSPLYGHGHARIPLHSDTAAAAAAARQAYDLSSNGHRSSNETVARPVAQPRPLNYFMPSGNAVDTAGDARTAADAEGRSLSPLVMLSSESPPVDGVRSTSSSGAEYRATAYFPSSAAPIDASAASPAPSRSSMTAALREAVMRVGLVPYRDNRPLSPPPRVAGVVVEPAFDEGAHTPSAEPGDMLWDSATIAAGVTHSTTGLVLVQSDRDGRDGLSGSPRQSLSDKQQPRAGHTLLRAATDEDGLDVVVRTPLPPVSIEEEGGGGGVRRVVRASVRARVGSDRGGAASGSSPSGHAAVEAAGASSPSRPRHEGRLLVGVNASVALPRAAAAVGMLTGTRVDVEERIRVEYADGW